jgi:bla regulator protein blaR1
MPAMFVFLLKVNIALLLFCAGYYLVLRHLTFYTLNRVYLVAAIVFATVYPKINLTDFAQRHEQLARPVQTVVYNLETPVQTLVKPLVQPDYWYWLELVFWMGVGLLAGRLLVQLFSMYKMYRNSTPAVIEDHDVRLINSDSGPFSFWKSIYINPKNHDARDIKSILLHEQVHVSELHTLDILLAELSTIFYWFNPGVWLMKKAVRENIEFITDRKILNKGIDSKEYQYSLVNVILTPSNQSIVNNFNLSTIKKRIIMMNAKRSSSVNLTRYILLVPVVVALLLVFSVSKAELNIVTKNSVHLLKALKNEVSKINFTDKKVESANNGIYKNNVVLNVVSRTNIQIDTIRQVLLTTLDTNKKGSPQLPVYIDGVRSEFNNIDPEKIARMLIYRDEKIKTNDPEKSGYISVITKGNEDSEAVKAFNEKMHKQFGNVITINDVTLVADNITTINNVKFNGLTATPGTVTGLTGVRIVNSKLSKLNEVVVTGHKLNALKINRDSAYRISGKDSLYGVKVINGRLIDLTNPKSKDSSAHAITKLYLTTALPKKVNGTVITTNSVGWLKNGSSGQINFADKLIIIDGKEATQKELRKLSADKIQSISNLTNYDAEKKYGDKGKNGAVLITTKN